MSLLSVLLGAVPLQERMGACCSKLWFVWEIAVWTRAKPAQKSKSVTILFPSQAESTGLRCECTLTIISWSHWSGVSRLATQVHCCSMFSTYVCNCILSYRQNLFIKVIKSRACNTFGFVKKHNFILNLFSMDSIFANFQAWFLYV